MEPSNILSINSLSKEWCDKDMVLLHACFQVLTDCVEKENLLEVHENWETDPKLKKVKEEIGYLYHWWKQRKDIEDQGKTDEIWTEEKYEKDNEMLIRLIKVRQYLWT
jgi:hypothetical protein